MTSNTDALLSLRQQSQPLMMWVEFRDFCSHIIEIASTQSRSFPLWMAHRLVSIIFPSLAVLSVALFFFFFVCFSDLRSFSSTGHQVFSPRLSLSSLTWFLSFVPTEKSFYPHNILLGCLRLRLFSVPTDGHWVLRPVGHAGRQRTPNIQQMAGAQLNLPMSPLLAKHKSPEPGEPPIHHLTVTSIHQNPLFMLFKMKTAFLIRRKTSTMVLQRRSTKIGSLTKFEKKKL